MKKKIKNQFDISFLPETATPATHNPVLGGEADNGKGGKTSYIYGLFYVGVGQNNTVYRPVKRRPQPPRPAYNRE